MSARVPVKPLQSPRWEHHQPRTLREAYNELHLLDSTLQWRGNDGAGLDLGRAARGFGKARSIGGGFVDAPGPACVPMIAGEVAPAFFNERCLPTHSRYR